MLICREEKKKQRDKEKQRQESTEFPTPPHPHPLPAKESEVHRILACQEADLGAGKVLTPLGILISALSPLVWPDFRSSQTKEALS